MLENERIIVQDRGGIDAGIAALMQNANKGFDPAALMAMMNNGNGMFGGNGGWWWIFIIVLFWMWGGWGGNGFGRGNQAETNSDFARLAAMGNQNNNTDLLMQAINGNKDAINTLSTNLNCDVKSIDNALCSIQNAIGKVGGEVGFSAERVINAVNAGDCNVIKAISDCCCTTQRSIDSVNLNLTQMNADNRLSICQQTNTLQNAITSGFNTLSSLGICPKVWCQLPREGVMVFEARHTPAEASAELPVLISPTGSVSPAANTKNIPVVKADSSPLTGSEIAAGNRYFIYYNKCDNVMQVMNHYPITTAAPAA